MFSHAQNDTITIIDFYGLKSLDTSTIRAAINLKEGQPFNRETYNGVALTETIRKINGVKDAQVATVCCDDAKSGWMIFIGINEGDLPAFTYLPSPTGKDSLPEDVVSNYRLFESMWRTAIQNGQSAGDDSKGHALLVYKPAEPVQEKFEITANTQLSLLRNVLKNSANAEHRSIAAWILPFYRDKKQIVPDLLGATHDADETVRNNSTRALAVMAKYAATNKSSGIVIPGDSFIDMLRSLTWTDRNKGAAVLEALTVEKNPVLLNQLKQKALPALVEMAKWKNAGHAAFSFSILGRIAGIKEKDISKQVNDLKRNQIVDAWAAKVRRN